MRILVKNSIKPGLGSLLKVRYEHMQKYSLSTKCSQLLPLPPPPLFSFQYWSLLPLILLEGKVRMFLRKENSN